MPTGSSAKRTLYQRVRTTEVLLKAWHAIRRNGETSRSAQTRQKTREFGAELPNKLRRIQERLRDAPYQFSPQIGVLINKDKGKGKRPLLVSSIEDRVVQRAILDVLQSAHSPAGIKTILDTPTSIGGVPGRGVSDAINMIDNLYRKGLANFVAGSDISGFFTQIDQSSVVQFLASQTDDFQFVTLFKNALKVELANAAELGPENLGLFPTDDRGVAQGCPLSALAGNVVLQDFDREFNTKGIVCIRYIDDFILLGAKEKQVKKALGSASKHLLDLGMRIYDPKERPDKAFSGPFTNCYEFLGYKLIPGQYPPAPKSIDRFLDAIDTEFGEGRAHILRALNSKQNGKRLQYYVQTLAAVDLLIRAWSGSFKSNECADVSSIIDRNIDERISNFIAFYRTSTLKRSLIEKRRALGIHLVSDDVALRRAG